MPTLKGINIDRRKKLQKNFVTIEFRVFDLCRVSNFIKTEALATFVQNYGLKDDRCLYWHVSNLTGIKNHKKLLPLVNSPPSICVEYKISWKLKHLPFFVQNYGLKDDRFQQWQVSILTGVEITALDWYRVQNFIKIEAFAVLRPKLWPKRWQVPTLLNSFPVPHSPF